MWRWTASPVLYVVGAAALMLLQPQLARAETAGDAIPEAASNQPPKENKTAALKHFKLGTQLVEDEAWNPALAEFSRSLQLYPTRVATQNAALCLERLKRYDEALDLYEQLLSKYGQELGTEDEQLIAAAVERNKGFVGVLVIQSNQVGAKIKVSGRLLGLTKSEASSHRLVVGTHLLRITHPDYQLVEQRVDVASGQETTVRVELIPRVGTEKRATATPKTPAPPTANPWLFVSGGVAVAGAATGVVFGLQTLSDRARANETCQSPEDCDAPGANAWDDARRSRLFSNIGWGVAAIGAGVSAYLFFGDSEQSLGVQPEGAGASLHFRQVW